MGKAKIDSTSSAYDAMAPRLVKANALLGGTRTMREAGLAMLPRYSSETPKNWRTRMNRAVLFNYFKKTVRALGGKPFSKAMKVEGADPRLEELFDDIDLQNNSFHVVAQREFTNALAKGMAIFLVDFPVNTATNAAEEKQQNLRPYLVPIAPENLIAAYSDQDGTGREIITHARVASCEIVREGYDEIEIETIMVYEPGTWERWQRRAKNQAYARVASGLSGLDYVPIVVFYTEKEAPFVSALPLEDLMDKNIEHWQSASDQRHCLTVARFPMLAGQGVSKAEGEIVKVGPYETLFTEDVGGKFYYVEHTGAALASGKQDLDDIKAEMAILALEMTAPKDRQTATSVMADSSDSYSVLQMLTINYMDCLAAVLEVMADWMKIPHESAGTVKLHTDFNITGFDAKVLDSLVAARNAGDLDSKTFLSELQRRGILSDELDVEELAKEAEKRIEQMKMDTAKAARDAATAKTPPQGKMPMAGSPA